MWSLAWLLLGLHWHLASTTCHLPPGTFNLAPGAWLLTPDTWYLAWNGTWHVASTWHEIYPAPDYHPQFRTHYKTTFTDTSRYKGIPRSSSHGYFTFQLLPSDRSSTSLIDLERGKMCPRETWNLDLKLDILFWLSHLYVEAFMSLCDLTKC